MGHQAASRKGSCELASDTQMGIQGVQRQYGVRVAAKSDPIRMECASADDAGLLYEMQNRCRNCMLFLHNPKADGGIIVLSHVVRARRLIRTETAAATSPQSYRSRNSYSSGLLGSFIHSWLLITNVNLRAEMAVPCCCMARKF